MLYTSTQERTGSQGKGSPGICLTNSKSQPISAKRLLLLSQLCQDASNDHCRLLSSTFLVLKAVTTTYRNTTRKAGVYGETSKAISGHQGHAGMVADHGQTEHGWLLSFEICVCAPPQQSQPFHVCQQRTADLLTYDFWTPRVRMQYHEAGKNRSHECLAQQSPGLGNLHLGGLAIFSRLMLSTLLKDCCTA